MANNNKYYIRIGFAAFLGLGLVLCLLWLLAPLETVQAATNKYYVSAEAGSSDNNDCYTITTPCRSVQHAVNLASAGDAIHIAVGNYSASSVTTTGNYALVDITKSLTIIGGWNTAFTIQNPANYPTILDSEQNSRVIYISGSITSTIMGVVINGGRTMTRGAGIYVENAKVTISDTIILGNAVTGTGTTDGGGGIYFVNADHSRVFNSIIVNNTGANGSGIYALTSNGMLFQNTSISSNIAITAGGGLYLNGSGTILNGYVNDNQASDGGGVYLHSGSYTIANTIIADNQVGNRGGAVYAQGNAVLVNNTLVNNKGSEAIILDGTSPYTVILTNTIIAGHSLGIINLGEGQVYNDHALFWNNITTTAVVSNNIHNSNSIACDPMFVNANAGDYRLLGTSCALDRGASVYWPLTDYQGQPRASGLGKRFDIGANEYYYTLVTDTLILHTPPTSRISEAVTFEAFSLAGEPSLNYTYTWYFGDSSPVMETNWTIITHTYTNTGTYFVTLTVASLYDQFVLTDVLTDALTVITNSLVVADAGILYRPIAPITIYQDVTFTGFAISGTDPITYTWLFHDGDKTGRTVSRTFDSPGLYTVLLSVTNAYSSSIYSLATQVITVYDPEGSAYYVTPTGDDALECSLPYPCRSIQRGVNVAYKDDTVYVAGGDYGWSALIPTCTVGTRGLVDIAKTVTIVGGWNNNKPTILDAEQQNRVIYIGGNVTPTLRNLQIRGGKTVTRGGGIYVNGAHPIIRDSSIYSNVVTGNGATDGGGGIYFENADDSEIFNTGIYSNSGNYGGGIFITGSNELSIDNTNLMYNQALYDGGGLYFANESLATVLNAVSVISNTAINYGGMRLLGDDATLTDVRARENFGQNSYGGLYIDSDNAQITRLTLRDNTVAADYSGGYISGQDIQIDTFTVRDNQSFGALARGGGLYLNGSGTLHGGYVAGNQAHDGGGIYLNTGPYTVANTLIVDNQIDIGGNGSGIYACQDTILANSTLVNNNGGGGQGIYFAASAPYTLWIKNAIVTTHTVGIERGGVGPVYNDYALLWGNASNTRGGVFNTHLVADDPDFGNNYRIPYTSPAYDAGTSIPWLVRDIDQDPRPSGAASQYDIGADEYHCVISSHIIRNPATPRVDDVITFEAFSGYDERVIAYTWDFEGTIKSGRTVTHTYDSAGPRSVELTVTSYCGLEMLSKAVNVKNASTSVAVDGAGFFYTPSSLLKTHQVITFTGYVITGTNPITYTWQFDDGTIIVGPRVVTHSFSVPGTRKVTMNVENVNIGNGNSYTDIAERFLSICEPGSGPQFLVSPPNPIEDEAADFYAWTIEGSPNNSFEWDFGDDSGIGYGQVVNHTFDVWGDYNAAVTITNQCDYSTAYSTISVVQAGDLIAPGGTVGFVTQPTVPEVGDLVTFIGYSTNGIRTIEYTWDFGDENLSIPTTAYTYAHVYDAPGTYMVVLTLTNSEGTATSSAPITVVNPIALSKTGPLSVVIGDLVTYTLSVTNNTNYASFDAVLTDTVPTGTDYYTGGTVLGNVVSFTTGVLPIKSSAQFSFSVRATAPQTVTNCEYRFSDRDGSSTGGAICVETFVMVPIEAVTITGPTAVELDTIFNFDADVFPLTATESITHVWQATEQTVFTDTSGGITSQVPYSWATLGPKYITVTATDIFTTVTNTHAISIFPTVQFSPTNHVITEANTDIVVFITVELDTTPILTGTVDYARIGGSATPGVDLIVASGTLTFTPGGATIRTIPVTITGDTAHECDETLVLGLTNPVNLIIGDATTTLTIVDDESDPELRFDAPPYSATEGDMTAPITLTLNSPSECPISVDFFTSDGTATASQDYTSTSRSVTFAAMASTTVVTIPIIDDGFDEPDGETVTLTLANASNADISSPNPSTLTILDNDEVTATFSSDVYSVTEGTSTAVVTVRLNITSTRSITVAYTTGDDTAQTARDYTLTSGTLTFTANNVLPFSVPIVNDNLNEPNETIILTLTEYSSIVNLGSPHTATLTIFDDDIPQVQFSSATYAVTEDTTSTAITATLNITSWQTVSVTYTTGDGLATAGSDYYTSTGVLTYSPGITTGTFTVPITEDVFYELDETVILSLTYPVNAIITATNPTTLTIMNDDLAPTVTLTIASQNKLEDVGTMIITATLNTVSELDVIVPFTNNIGTATPVADYTITDSPVTITAGSLTATIAITVVDDVLYELDESVVLALVTPANATLGTTTRHTATIKNNDLPPTLTFITDSQIAAENVGTIPITVTLNITSGLDVGVSFAVITGTATPANDYNTITTSPVTISAGSVVTRILIAVNDDTIDEPDETVVVTLSNPTSATLGSPSTHTVTIQDNDVPQVQFSSATYTVMEDTTSTTVTATLNITSWQTVSVTYTSNDGTATAGSDYLTSTGVLTYSPGITTMAFTVPITDDVFYELDETVILSLTYPVNAIIAATNPATLIIENDDLTPTVTLTPSTQVVSESVGTITITAKINTVSGADTVLPFAVAGTAMPGMGLDYTITPGPVIIAAGNLTASIVININDDTLYENDETISVTLGAPINAVLGANTVYTVTIQNNDLPPTLTFATALQSVPESAGTIPITVTLNTTSGLDVIIPFTPSPAPGTDYTISPSPVTISAGSVVTHILIAVNDDTIDEPDETVVVTLSNPTSATLGSSSAHTVTIQDDDVPQVQFSSAMYTVTEANTSTAVTATLNITSWQTVSVTYTTSDGMATAGSDYLTSTGVLTYSPGITTVAFTVPITDDVFYELDETIILSLTYPVNAIITATNPATLTIENDDLIPTVTLTPTTQVVSESVGTITITAKINTVSGADTILPFAVTGTAMPGMGFDYTITPSPVIIAAGNLTTSIVINIDDDTLYENDETISVTLGTAINAVLGANTVYTVIIQNNDLLPTVTYLLASQSVSESVGTLPITVTLNTVSGLDVIVPFTPTGIATLGADYTVISSPVTIAAGNLITHIVVTINNDWLYENDEHITLTLGSPVSANLGIITTHAITIENTDPTPRVAFTVDTQSGLEDSVGTMTITAALIGQSDLDITLPFTDTGTASDTDYTITPSPVTISAGSLITNIVITVITDTIAENDETVNVQLLPPTNADLDASTAHTAIILNDDPNPSVSFVAASQSVSESVGTMPIVITLSKVSELDVGVSFQVTGTAESPDYTIITTTPITIPAGNLTTSISMIITDDTLYENDEIIIVTMETPVNSTLGTSTAHTVTIENNDPPPTVTFLTAWQSVWESAGVVPITVTLNTTSGLDVIVPFTPAPAPSTDYTIIPSPVTITAGSLITQVFVTVNDDVIDEPDETVTVTMSAPISATLGLSTTHSITIQDNDPMPIMSINDTTVNEGDIGTTVAAFIVTLSHPSAFTVTAVYSTTDSTATAGSDYISKTDLVTFVPYSTNQSITVTVNGDVLDEGAFETFTISLTNPISATIGDGYGVCTIIDDDNAGVTVVPTTGLTTTEAGDTATFSVTLNSEPTAIVTITLTSSDPGEGIVTPTQQIFDDSNWFVAQTAIVTGQDDFVADGDIPYTIQTSLSSADSNYGGIDPDDVSLTNLDVGDLPGVIVTPTTGLTTTETGDTATFSVVLTSEPTDTVTITLTSSDPGEGIVAPTPLLFGSGNYSVSQTAIVTGQDDFVADGDIPYTIQTSLSSADSNYGGIDPDDVSLTNLDVGDIPGVIVTPTTGLTTTEAGVTATFSVVLTSEPTDTVTITLTSSDPGEGIVAPTPLLFGSGNYSVSQTAVVTGQDDSVADGDIPYTIQTSLSSADSNYGGIDPDDVSLTNLNDDEAGVIVTPTTGLTTTEEGVTATFSVVLTSEPTDTVTITLTSIDPSEGIVTPTPLLFGSGNYSVSQTAVVTGQDDFVDDGDILYTIQTTLSSADSIYNAIDPDDVSLTNLDVGDIPGVIVTPTTGLTTTEEGVTATFSVVLTSEPIATVTITLTSIDPSEGIVPPTPLLFNSGNYSVSQTAVVTGQDDFVADGDILYAIQTTLVSTDSIYNAIDPDDVSLTNLDVGDIPGVIVTPTTGLTTTEAGGTAIFSVVLTSEPTGTVTITFSSSNPSEGVAPGTPRSFDNVNWFMPQAVTVTGKNDFVVDGNIPYTIYTALASTDPIYADIDPDDVSLINIDDDISQVSIVGQNDGAEPNVNGRFYISLTHPVMVDVTVAYTVSGTALNGTDYETLTGTVSITLGHTSATILVSVIDDNWVEDNETITLTLSGTDHPQVALGVPSYATIGINDNDEASLSITDASVVEGDGGTVDAVFTVTLSLTSTQPIIVDYDTADGTAVAAIDYIGISSSPLLFAAGNRTGFITVTVLGDLQDEYDETFYVNLTNAVNATIADNQGEGIINNDDDLNKPDVFIGDVNVDEGDGGPITATFIVSMSVESGKSVTITYATADADAIAGYDYDPVLSNYFVFSPNETSHTISITVFDDIIDEYDESFFVNLLNADNASLVDSQGQGTIVDNDLEPWGYIRDAIVLEGDDGPVIATFVMTLSVESGKPITVTFITTDGTAIAPYDYISMPLTTWQLFLPGEIMQTIAITVNGDLHAEEDETFFVNPSNPVNVRLDQDRSVGLIKDDDAAVIVDRTMLGVSEGGLTDTYQIYLKSQPTNDVTIVFEVNNQQLESIEPRVFGLLNWDTPQTILVRAFDDDIFESSVHTSTITHQVFSADDDYQQIAVSDVLVSIADNERGPSVQFENSVYAVSEDDGLALVTVVLTETYPLTVQVDYVLLNGTAMYGQDYESSNGTLIFSPGVRIQTFSVTVMFDNVREGTETVLLFLQNPHNAKLGAINPATLEIWDKLVQPNYVTIQGPQHNVVPQFGTILPTCVFTATTRPQMTTLPLTYTWWISGRSAITHPWRELEDNIVVAFEAVGTWPVVVTVTNGFGTVSDIHSITITTNTIPIITNIYITPSEPDDTDSFTVVYEYDDSDDHPDHSLIRWYRDRVLQPRFNGVATIPGGIALPGEYWCAQVIPYDRVEYGTIEEACIYINPQPQPEPITPGVSISPTTPVAENDLEIVGLEEFTGDGFQVRWYRDDTFQANYYGETMVLSLHTYAGEIWCASILFHYEFHDILVEDCVVIRPNDDNYLPQSLNPQITPLRPTSNDSLILDIDYSDLEGDVEWESEIRWYRNGFLQPSLNNTITVESLYTSPGDWWYATIRPGDEPNSPYVGLLSKTPIVTIHEQDGNTAPFLHNIRIIPAQPATTEPLRLTYTYEDVDGDIQGETRIRWYRAITIMLSVPGQGQVSVPHIELEPDYNDLTVIPAGETALGETWFARVTPHDGHVYGRAIDAHSVTINPYPGNTQPKAMDVYISPGRPDTWDDLKLHYAFYDRDLDLEGATKIRWFRQPANKDYLVYQPAYNDRTFIEEYNTARDEVWYATVAPYDGQVYGQVVTVSVEIVAQGIVTSPEIQQAYISPWQPRTNESLQLHHTAYDPDRLLVQNESVQWYLNGYLQPQLDGLTYVPSTIMAPGQQWHAVITLENEDTLEKLIREVYTVTVNHPPTLSLRLASDTSFDHSSFSPSENQYVELQYQYYDLDKDPANVIHTRWYQQGRHRPEYDDQFTLSFSDASKGVGWQATAVAHDGFEYGRVFTSSILPQVINAEIQPDAPKPNDYLALYYQLLLSDTVITSMPDAWTIIRWTVNGVKQPALNDMNSIPAYITAEGEKWCVTILPHFDGVYGIPDEDCKIILPYNSSPNSRGSFSEPATESWPVGHNVDISPYRPYSEDDLKLNANVLIHGGLSRDELDIVWTVDGERRPELGDATFVPANMTQVGQTWCVRVNTFGIASERRAIGGDCATIVTHWGTLIFKAPEPLEHVLPPADSTRGHLDFDAETSLSVSKNITPALTISPTNPEPGVTLRLEGLPSDLITDTIRWYEHGIRFDTANGREFLPGQYVKAAQVWTATAELHGQLLASNIVTVPFSSATLKKIYLSAIWSVEYYSELCYYSHESYYEENDTEFQACSLVVDYPELDEINAFPEDDQDWYLFGVGDTRSVRLLIEGYTAEGELTIYKLDQDADPPLSTVANCKNNERSESNPDLVKCLYEGLPNEDNPVSLTDLSGMYFVRVESFERHSHSFLYTFSLKYQIE